MWIKEQLFDKKKQQFFLTIPVSFDVINKFLDTKAVLIIASIMRKRVETLEEDTPLE